MDIPKNPEKKSSMSIINDNSQPDQQKLIKIENPLKNSPNGQNW